MIAKHRYESKELKLLRCLNARMELSEKDSSNYLYLEKGFKGEQSFDELIENLSDNWLILTDLLFESNNTLFQIDSLLLSQDTIYLIEIKNYEGDFYIEGDRWYSISKNEIKNPLLQLKRSESLLRRLLQDLGFTSSKLETYLIFVNPDFYLYQTPMNLPIIFPSQLNRFINKLTTKSSTLKDKHSKLAQQLLSLHLNESPYSRLPDYTFEQLEKGIMCELCHSFITDYRNRSSVVVCNKCGHEENAVSAVLRSVNEFIMLFPDRSITTTVIHKWCKGIMSRKVIRRILSSKYKLQGHSSTSHYVNNKSNNDKYL